MIDTGVDWMLAPLVWLVLLGGMLLSMEAGKRVRVRHLRAAQSDSTGFAAIHGRSCVRFWWATTWAACDETGWDEDNRADCGRHAVRIGTAFAHSYGRGSGIQARTREKNTT